MRLLEAALEVLNSVDRPLHVNELTRLMIEQGLWNSRGKTPAATVRSEIARHIKSNPQNPKFLQTAPQTFRAKVVKVWRGKKPAPVVEPKKEVASSQGMSLIEYAQRILASSKNNQPLSPMEMAKIALTQGFVASSGEVTVAFFREQLEGAIRSEVRLGRVPVFFRTQDGRYGLNSWNEEEFQYLESVQAHNQQALEEMRERIFAMNTHAFTITIGTLLSRMGVKELTLPQATPEGLQEMRGYLEVAGIRRDLYIVLRNARSNVQGAAIQKVRTALSNGQRGVFITSGDFSKAAQVEKTKRDAPEIYLINGTSLVELCLQYGVGVGEVQPSPLTLNI